MHVHRSTQVTAGLMVVSPLPARFFWPGLLLPSVMVGFLAQGSKFLFFDTRICQGFVWVPFGENVTPRTANSCTLGRTGIFAIAAGSVYFFSLLLVCLKTPQKRQLQEDYGKTNDSPDEGVEAEGAFLDNSMDEENQYFTVIAPVPSALITSRSSEDEGFEAFDGVSSHHSDDPFFNKGALDTSTGSNVSEQNLDKAHTRESVSDYDYVPNEMKNDNDQEDSVDNRDDVASEQSATGASIEKRLQSDSIPIVDTSSPQKLTPKEEDDDEDRGYLPYKTSESPTKISQTRLSKKEEMEVGQHDEALIDKFVLEFEKSFADDESNAVSTVASF